MTGFILKKESQIMYDPTTCGILKKKKITETENRLVFTIGIGQRGK